MLFEKMEENIPGLLHLGHKIQLMPYDDGSICVECIKCKESLIEFLPYEF